MKFKAQTVLIFSFFLLLLLSLSFASAIQIVPKLKLCTSETCFDNSLQISLKPNQSVMLQLSIINDQNKFICFDSISYQFKLSSENLGDKERYIQRYLLSTHDALDTPSFCLKPDKSIETLFYLPLKDYNEATKQLGKWEINEFQLSFSNMKCYRDFNLKNSDCGSMLQSSTFIANPVEFNVRQDEPSKGWNPASQLKTLFKILAFLTGIFAVICLEEAVRNKKKRIVWIVTLIITAIILYFFAFYGFFNG